MAIAGKVMPVPRGNYDPKVVYDVLDIVKHNSQPWIAKKPNLVGVEPSLDNADSWMLMFDIAITDAGTLDGHDSTYFLSKEEASTIRTATFLATGWTEAAPYTQVVDVDGMTDTSVPTPSFYDDSETEEDSKAKLKAYAFISYFDSGTNIVMATCKYNKPTVDFSVAFKSILL